MRSHKAQVKSTTEHKYCTSYHTTTQVLIFFIAQCGVNETSIPHTSQDCGRDSFNPRHDCQSSSVLLTNGIVLPTSPLSSLLYPSSRNPPSTYIHLPRYYYGYRFPPLTMTALPIIAAIVLAIFHDAYCFQSSKKPSLVSVSPITTSSSFSALGHRDNFLATSFVPDQIILPSRLFNAKEETEGGNVENMSKRIRFLNFLGLKKTSRRHESRLLPVKDIEDGTKPKDEFPVEAGPFSVTTIDELEDYYNDVRRRFRKRKSKFRKHQESDNIDYDALLASLSVVGDTQIIGSPDHKDMVHPVVRLLHERRRQIEEKKNSSEESNGCDQLEQFNNARGIKRTMPKEDGFRVALVVEGGGMRGCVTAGMVAAIHYLGLEDTIDVVYGSSAGTVIGAYCKSTEFFASSESIFL